LADLSVVDYSSRMKYIFTVFCLFFFHFTFAALLPTFLTCEYRNNPLGVDAAQPRFSWQFIPTGRGQYQTAYQIIVSDNISDVNTGHGNHWDSTIPSSQNTHIDYKGKELQSFTKYFWRVRVFDEKGEASTWSDIATFEMAMLHATDWKANWITDGSKQFERDEDFYKDDPMPLFRKSFTAKKKILSARLYIAGLGYYEAYLNGKKVGDQVLDPGWTTYDKQVLYAVHDITSMVKEGDNVGGIMLGNGWFNPLPLRMFSRFNLRDAQYTERPCVKAEIHIRYEDGNEDVIHEKDNKFSKLTKKLLNLTC